VEKADIRKRSRSIQQIQEGTWGQTWKHFTPKSSSYPW